jgi:hypothetical protein
MSSCSSKLGLQKTNISTKLQKALPKSDFLHYNCLTKNFLPSVPLHAWLLTLMTKPKNDLLSQAKIERIHFLRVIDHHSTKAACHLDGAFR